MFQYNCLFFQDQINNMVNSNYHDYLTEVDYLNRFFKLKKKNAFFHSTYKMKHEYVHPYPDKIIELQLQALQQKMATTKDLNRRHVWKANKLLVLDDVVNLHDKNHYKHHSFHV